MGNFFRRILAFILGIVFCVTASVGGIVGGAYWAYKNLTLSKVGVNDPSLGDLTDQPIEDLVDLVINGAKDPSSYTFAELEKKYGLKLEDILSKFGLKVEIVTKDQELNFKALKDISIFTLFDKSGDGINLLLDSLSARALFNFFPDSFLSAGTRAQLSVYSVADLVNKEETTGKLGLYSALNSAKVGGILPTVFEEKYNQSTHTYEYEVKEDKNQALSLVKDMEVGAFIKTFIDGDSDILTELNSGGLSSIGDMQISEVFGTIAGAFSESAKETVEKYGQILAGKTVRDLFVLTENGKYSFAIENLFNDIKLGYIFGYKEVDGVWYDGDKVANGVLGVLSDVNLYNIVKGISESKVKDAIISELGIINLGDVFEQFLGYKQENGQWVDANGKAMPKILQGLAGVSVAQIFDEDAPVIDNIINALDESFGDITAGDVLADFVGFKKVDEQWVDEKGNELNPILSGLLSMKIADLIRKDYTLETIVGIFKEAIGDVKAGEILGYTFDGAKQIWVDSNGNPVNAYINVLCGMDCNNVLDIFLADDSPTNVVRTLLGDIKMGDLLVAVLKYSYDEENGKWLTSKGNEAPAGVAKLAEIELWQFVAAFDKNEPFNLYDMLDGLTLGDFIGVYDEETDTYTITADIIPSLKGKVLSGVLSTLLNIDIGHFLDANTENDEYVQILKDITIGQVVQAITGYAQNTEGDWIAPEGKNTDRLLELLCAIRLSVNDVVELVQGKLTASEFVSKLLGELKVGDFLGSAFGLHYDTATNSFLDKNNEKTYDLYDFLMNINANDVIAFIETKDVLATIKEFISPLQIGDFFAPFMQLKEQDGIWTRENGTQRLIHILESVFNLYLTNIIDEVETVINTKKLYLLDIVSDVFGETTTIEYYLDFVKLPDNEVLAQIVDIVIYDLVNDLMNENDKAEVLLKYFGEWSIGEALDGVLPARIENNQLTQNIFALSVHSIYTDIIKSSDVLTALEEKVFDGVSLSTIVSYALEDQSKLPAIVKDLLALEINYIIDNVKTAVDTGNVYIGNIVKTICGERTIKDYLQDFVKLPDNEVLNQVTSVVISDFVTDLGKDDKAEVILEYFGEWTIGQALKGILPKAIEDNQLTQNVFALSLYAIYTQIVKADDVLAAVEEKVFDGVALSTLVSYAVDDQSKFPNIAKDLLALEVNYIIDTVKTAIKDQTIYLGNIINKICKGRTIADYVEDFVKLPDNKALNQIKSVVICDFYNDLIASSDKAQVILDYFGSWTLGEALGKENKQESEITTQNAYDASVLNSGAATQALVNGTTVEAGNKFTENMYALSALSVYTDIIKANDVLAAIEEKVFDGVTLSMIAAYAIANQSGLPNIVKDIFAVEVNYIIDTVKTSIDTGVVYIVDIVSKVCGDRTIGDYLDFVKLPDNDAVNKISSVVIRDFVKDLFDTSDKTDVVLDAFGTWTVGDAIDGVLPARLKENQFIKNVIGISAKTFYTDILKSSDVFDSVKTKILNEVKFSTIADFVVADQSKLPKIAKDLLNVELNYVADTVKQISADGIVYLSDIVRTICGDSTIGDYIKDFVKLPDNEVVNKVTSVVISAFVADIIDESDKVQVILDYFGTWTIGEVLNGVLPQNIEDNRLTQNVFALSAITIYTDIVKASDILAAVQDKVLDGVKFSTLLAYAMQDQTKLPTIAHDLLGVEINYIINIIKSGKIDVADTVAYVCGVHTINDYLKDFVTLPDIDALNKITSIVISEFVNDIFNQNDKVQVLLDYFGVVRFGEILGGLTGYEEDEEFGVWVRKDDKNLKAYTLLEIAYDLEIKDVLGFALGGKFGTNDIATFIQESVQGNETIGSLLYDLIGMTNEEGVYYFSNGQRAFRAIQEVFGINIVELIKDAETYLKNYASYELDDIIQMIGELEGYSYDYKADKFTETPVFAYVTVGVAGIALYFLANDVLVDLVGDMTYFDALKDALNVTENNGKYVFADTNVDTSLYNKLMPKKMGETLKKGYDFLGEFKDVLGVGNAVAPFTDKLGKYTVSYTTEESGEITWKVVGDFGSVISGLYNVTYTGLEKAIKDKTIADYVIGLFKEVSLGDVSEKFLPEKIKTNKLVANVLDVTIGIIYYDLVKGSDRLATIQQYILDGVSTSTLLEFVMTKEKQDKLPRLVRDLTAVEFNYIIDEVKTVIDTKKLYLLDIISNVVGETTTIKDYLDFVKLPNNDAVNKVTAVVIYEFAEAMISSDDKTTVILDYFGTFTIGDVLKGGLPKNIEDNQLTQNVYALSALIIYEDIVKADDILAAVEEKVLTNVTLSTLLAYAMADQSKLPLIAQDALALEINFIIDTTMQIVKDKVVYVSNIVGKLFGERTVGDYLQDFVTIPGNRAIVKLTNIVIYDFVMDVLRSNDKVQVLLNYLGSWTVGDLFETGLPEAIENNQFTQNVYKLSANIIYNDIVKSDDILAAVEEKVFDGVALSTFLAYVMEDQSKLPNIAKDLLAVEVNYIIDTVKQIIDTQIVYVADIVKKVCGDRTIGDYLDFIKLPGNDAVEKVTSVVISEFVADMFRNNDKAQVLLDYFGTIRVGEVIAEATGYVEDKDFGVWIRKDDKNLKAYTLLEIAYDLALNDVLGFLLDGKFKANDVADFVQKIVQGNETIGSLLTDLIGITYTDGKYYFENGQRAYRIIAEAFGINVVELIKDAQTYLKNYASYDLDDIIQMIGELEGYSYDYNAEKFTKTPVLAYVTVAAIGAVMYFVANDVLVDLAGDMTYFDALKDALNVTENEGKYVFADTNVDTPLYNKLMPTKIGATLKKGYDFKGEFKDVLGVGNLAAPFTNKLGKYTVSYLTTYSEEGTIAWKVEGNYGSVISGLYNVTYNGLEKAIKDKKVGDYVLDLFGEVSVGDLTVQIIPEKIKSNKLIENVNAITVNTVYNEFVKGSDKLAAVQENVLNEVSTSTLLGFAMTQEKQDKLPRLVRDLTAVEFNYIIDEVKTVIDTKKLYLLDIISEVMGKETTIRDYLDFVTLPNNDVVNKVTAVVIYDFAEAMINGENKVDVIIDYFGTWTIGDVFYNTFSKEIENNQFTQNVFALSVLSIYTDIVKADDVLAAVEEKIFTNVTLSTFLAYAMADQSKLPNIAKDILAVEVNYIINTVKQVIDTQIVYVADIVKEVCGERTIGEYLDFVKLPNNKAINNITSVVISEFVADMFRSNDKVQVLLDYFGTWTIGDLLEGSFNKTIEENQLTQNVFALSANIIYNDIVKADDILAAVEEKVFTNVALSTLLAYAMADQSKLPTIVKDILAVEVNYIIDTAKQIAKDKVVYVSNIVGKLFGERTVGDYLQDFVTIPGNRAIVKLTNIVIYDFVMDFAASKDKVQVLLDYLGSWTIGDLLEGSFNKTIEENQLTQNVYALSAKAIYNDIVKADDILAAAEEKVLINVTLSTLLAYAMADQSKLPLIAQDALAIEVNYIIDTAKQIAKDKVVYVSNIVNKVFGDRTIGDYAKDFVKLPNNKAINNITSVVIYDFVMDLAASKDKVQVLLDYLGSWTIGDLLEGSFNKTIEENQLTQNVFALSTKAIYNDIVKANDKLTAVKENVFTSVTLSNILAYAVKDQSKLPNIAKDILAVEVNYVIDETKSIIDTKKLYLLDIISEISGETKTVKDYLDFVKLPDNKAINNITSVVIYDFADAMIASKDKKQAVLDYFGTWTIGEALGDKLGYAENEELGIWITKKDANVKANTLTETLFDMQIKTPISFLLKGKFTANDFATLAKEIVNDNETIGLLLYDMFEMKYTDNTYYFKNGQRAYRIVTEVFGLNVIELIKNAKTYIGDYAKYSFDDLVQMIGELEGYKYDYAADKFTKTPVLAYATLGAIGVGMYYGANDLLVKVCGTITYYSALKDVLKITRDGDDYLLGADKLATPLFNKVLPLKISETIKKGYDLKGLLKDVLSIGNLTAMYTSKLKLGGVAALDSEQNWTVSGKYGNVIAAIYNVNVFEANDAIRKRNGMTLKSYLLDTFDGIVAGDLLAPTLKAELKENVWYKDGKKYLRLYNDLLNTNVVEVIRFISDAAKSDSFNLRQLLYLMFTDDATVEYYFGQILKYSVNENGNLVNKKGEYANVVIENIFKENFINFIVTTVKNVSKPKTLITDVLGNAKIGDIILTGYRLNASDEWVKADGTVYTFGSSLAAIEKVVYKIEIADLINGFDAESIFGDMYIGELLGYTKDGEDWTDKDGNALAGFNLKLANITIKQLTETEDPLTLFNDMYIGELLGYTKTEEVWYGKDGNALTGFNLRLAQITIKQLTETEDPLTLFNDMYIGEILGYTKTGDVWYGKDGNALTGFNLRLAQITIEQLTTTDNPIELFGDVYVGEILGYTKNGNVWMRGDTQVTSRFDLVLAEITISQLIAAQNNPLSLFGDVYIGDIIGYTYDEANDKWIDQNDKEVKGFNLAIAKLKVGQINGESDMLTLFGDLTIGEMFGYTYENGKWQDKDGKDVNALVNAIASIKISDTTAEDFDLMTTVKDVKLGDVMGYTYDTATNKWAKDGAEAESLIQIIANYTIGGIQDGNFSSTLMNDITGTVTIKDIFKSIYESTDKTGMFALLTEDDWNQPVGNLETIMTNKMSNLVVADLAKLGVISDINKVVNSKIAINGVDSLLKTDADYSNYMWTDVTYDTSTGMISACSKKLIEQGATGEGTYWTEIVKLSDFFDIVFSASL